MFDTKLLNGYSHFTHFHAPYVVFISFFFLSNYFSFSLTYFVTEFHWFENIIYPSVSRNLV